MSKSNLKKSGVKKKSERAAQMAAEKEKEEKEAAEEKAARKKQAHAVAGTFADAAFPMYGLAAAIFSFLLNRIGVFSALGLVLGILGARRTRETKGKYFVISIIDILISGFTAILFVMYLIWPDLFVTIS